MAADYDTGPALFAVRTVDIFGSALDTLSLPLAFARSRGTDTVCGLFHHTIELKTAEAFFGNTAWAAAIDVSKMVGKLLTLSIELASPAALPMASGPRREITGLVVQARFLRAADRHAVYEVILRPWLYLATLNLDYRIFQGLSVPQVLAAVLGAYPYRVDYRLLEQYPPQEYLVQYGESDYAFISRLCREWGIAWHFEHAAGEHALVFGDAPTDPPAYAGYETVTFHPQGSRSVEGEYLHSAHWVETLTAGSWTATDYTFTAPRADLTVRTRLPQGHAHNDTNGQAEVFDYPGDHAEAVRPASADAAIEQGDMLARRRAQALTQSARRMHAQGNVRTICAGYAITLTGHPRPEANRAYRILSTDLELSDTADETDAEQRWHCISAFVAQPADVPYSPDYDPSDKPRTYGPQPATVVGEGEEPIWTDQYGRVKVRFHWDRRNESGATASAWLRVACPWQGDEFGATHVPRVGQEVLVDFMHGDPDCPVIVGRMVNSIHMPAWQLPSQAALSGFRSRELGGGRSNHLLMDDTPGELQTQLSSDHATSQLSLGYLRRIRDTAGRRDERRGEGFELRTDAHGAIRASAGLAVTTTGRENAHDHQTDLAEAVERLALALERHHALARAADDNHAQEGQAREVTRTLRNQHAAVAGDGPLGELRRAELLADSAAGMALLAEKELSLATGGDLAATAGGHLSLAGDRAVLLAAREALRLSCHPACGRARERRSVAGGHRFTCSIARRTRGPRMPARHPACARLSGALAMSMEQTMHRRSYYMVDGVLAGDITQYWPPAAHPSQERIPPWGWHAIYDEAAAAGPLGPWLIDIEEAGGVHALEGVRRALAIPLHLSVLHAGVDAEELVAHLRRFIRVRAPNGEVGFLRFADGRVVPELATILTPMQWTALCGPIERWIVCTRNGEPRELPLPPPGTVAAPEPLALDDRQCQALAIAFEPDSLLAMMENEWALHGEPLPGSDAQRQVWAIETATRCRTARRYSDEDRLAVCRTVFATEGRLLRHPDLADALALCTGSSLEDWLKSACAHVAVSSDKPRNRERPT